MMNEEAMSYNMTQEEEKYLVIFEEELTETTKIVEREFKKIEKSGAKNIKTHRRNRPNRSKITRSISRNATRGFLIRLILHAEAFPGALLKNSG
jgi:hypothetical protein